VKSGRSFPLFQSYRTSNQYLHSATVNHSIKVPVDTNAALRYVTLRYVTDISATLSCTKGRGFIYGAVGQIPCMVCSPLYINIFCSCETGLSLRWAAWYDTVHRIGRQLSQIAACCRLLHCTTAWRA